MNFGFVFKAVFMLVVVGGIFLVGFVVGGAFATGMSQDAVVNQLSQCLPAQTAADLDPCLIDEPDQP